MYWNGAKDGKLENSCTSWQPIFPCPPSKNIRNLKLTSTLCSEIQFGSDKWLNEWLDPTSVCLSVCKGQHQGLSVALINNKARGNKSLTTSFVLAWQDKSLFNFLIQTSLALLLSNSALDGHTRCTVQDTISTDKVSLGRKPHHCIFSLFASKAAAFARQTPSANGAAKGRWWDWELLVFNSICFFGLWANGLLPLFLSLSLASRSEWG